MFYTSWRRFNSLALSLGVLTTLASCQATPTSIPQLRVVSMGGTGAQNAVSVLTHTPKTKVTTIPKAQPKGELQVIPSAQNPSLSQVTLKFTYPKPTSAGFSTKALDCGEIQSIRVALKGLGLGINEGEPILANGADPQTEKLAAQGCSISATFDNVPSGTARIVSVSAYRSGINELADPTDEVPGTGVKTVLNLPTTTAREIGFHTTPAAVALEQLLESGEPVRQMAATEADLSQLEQVFKNLAGFSGGTNPTYANVMFHPLMFNWQNSALGDTLFQQYQTQGHTFDYNAFQTALPGAAASFSSAATANILVTGLLGNDRAQFQITDPMSPMALGGEAGLTIANIRPVDENLSDGTDSPWLLVATPVATGNGTQYTISYPQGQEVYAGIGSAEALEVEFVPVTPEITQLAGEHEPDTVATVTGNFFYQGDISYNTVEVDGLEAIVLSAPAANQLTFEIPTDVVAGPTVPVTVAVGTSTSLASTWAIHPRVDDVTPDAAAGDTITIDGAGFSDTLAENEVTFAGTSTPATIVSASNTQLTVTVPANAVSGAVNVVTRGMAASQQLAVNIGASGSISGSFQ